MALKIVRTTGPEQGARPLRLWLAGRRDEALAALAEPAAAEHPAEVAQLIERALADDLALAGTLGSALAAWEDDVEAYRLVRAAAEGLLDRADDQGPARWAPSGVALCELTLPVLEARPLEPVLLNYLGVALYGINEAPPRAAALPGRAPPRSVGREPARQPRGCRGAAPARPCGCSWRPRCCRRSSRCAPEARAWPPASPTCRSPAASRSA